MSDLRTPLHPMHVGTGTGSSYVLLLLVVVVEAVLEGLKAARQGPCRREDSDYKRDDQGACRRVFGSECSGCEQDQVVFKHPGGAAPCTSQGCSGTCWSLGSGAHRESGISSAAPRTCPCPPSGCAPVPLAQHPERAVPVLADPQARPRTVTRAASLQLIPSGKSFRALCPLLPWPSRARLWQEGVDSFPDGGFSSASYLEH